jgi:hypothetical protein
VSGVLADLTGNDLAAVLVSIGVAVAVAALVWAVGSLLRAARRLGRAADQLDEQAALLVEELRATVARTDLEVDRLDAVLSSAESITGTVDAASKLAYRAVSNPVVKTMAFATGTSRAAKRLRGIEDPAARPVTPLPAPRPDGTRGGRSRALQPRRDRRR